VTLAKALGAGMPCGAVGGSEDVMSVVEDGSVDELLSAGGRFEEFWRQQQDAADWRIHAV